MQILIKENADVIYVEKIRRFQGTVNWHFVVQLQEIKGRVKTATLVNNKFNVNGIELTYEYIDNITHDTFLD